MPANAERFTDVRTDGILLLALAAGLLLFVPTASGQPAACESVLENATEIPDNGSETPAEPGGQLAEAIGDQREEIGTALNDRRFHAKLANATSDRERARVVGAEVDRVESRLTAVERCWEASGDGAPVDDGDAQLDDEQREAIRNLTWSLHQRVNVTRAAAGDLPSSMREANGIDAASLEAVERRVVSLRTNVTRPTELSTPRGGNPFSPVW